MNCTMTWLVYLLTCKKCSIQYVGKTEWPFNQRLNKHRFDVPVHDAQDVDKHFNLPGHIFDRDAKFTLIEKIKNLENVFTGEEFEDKSKNEKLSRLHYFNISITAATIIRKFFEPKNQKSTDFK